MTDVLFPLYLHYAALQHMYMTTMCFVSIRPYQICYSIHVVRLPTFFRVGPIHNPIKTQITQQIILAAHHLRLCEFAIKRERKFPDKQELSETATYARGLGNTQKNVWWVKSQRSGKSAKNENCEYRKTRRFSYLSRSGPQMCQISRPSLQQWSQEY